MDCGKELCKLKKDQLAEIIPQLIAELPDCRFVCRKCARVAPNKKVLCKPISFEKATKSS